MPPDIPFITRASTPTKPKKPNVATALAGAATTIVKALSSSPKSSGKRIDEGAKMSPFKMATLRQNCLDHLTKLKELFEDNVRK